VIDFVGGRADLDAKVLRAIGDPYERFREDRLRLLRAVRMAARFQLTLDPSTQQAIKEKASAIGEGVSAERIAEELRKMLTDSHRVQAMRLLMDLGLAAAVMRELLPMRGLPQGRPRPGVPLPPPGMPGPPSPDDLWEHTLAVLGHLEKPSFPLALAALLHDVGKPRTVGMTPDRYTFHGHEHVGRQVANTIGLRLRLSNDERERVEWLVEKHQALADSERLRPAKLKTLLVHPGIEELIALHRADARASGRDEAAIDHAVRLRAEWDAAGTLWPTPLLTGHDLLEMGIAQGPVFKQVLEMVREQQMDGTLRTREEALEFVRRLLDEKS
jgi:poly(A) polymerase